MARILVTGSSDGLGSLAAQALVKKGHKVVLHARNAQRAKDAEKACPGAESVVTGDLSSMSETKKMAEQINSLGAFDAVIHNAGLYQGGFRKTSEGLPSLTAVNTFAPYILTCLISPRPRRVAFLSSGMHTGGDGTLNDITWTERGEKAWNDTRAYSDSKLHNVMLANAFARRWKNVSCNSMDPGWIATKMGGAGASGSPTAAVETYVMLAEGDGKGAQTGTYFRPGRREDTPLAEATDPKMLDKLIGVCEEVTGIKMPSE